MSIFERLYVCPRGIVHKIFYAAGHVNEAEREVSTGRQTRG
jgi:hypothetical protein